MSNEQIIEMYQSGYSKNRISFRLNIPLENIKEITKNIEIPNKIFTNEEIPKILKLYEDGVSAKILAIIYKIDRRRVFKFIKEAGIEKRTFSEGRRDIHWNQNIFDVVDTEEKAYWLGFFYADGYNYEKGRFQLILQARDFEHIAKCVDFFEAPRSIMYDTYSTSKKTGERHPQVGMHLHSKYLCARLAELGCMQAKSFLVDFPTWLNPELHQHFIRGVFEGDGCLTFREKQREWKWNIAGTDMLLIGIKKILDEKVNVYSKISNISKTGHNTSIVTTSGNIQVLKICDYLYNGATIYLNRKLAKYNDLIQFHFNKKRYFTDKEKDEFLELRKKGYSCQDIGKKYNCSGGGILKATSAFNQLPNSHINHNYFDEINSENKAYLLGCFLFLTKLNDNNIKFPNIKTNIYNLIKSELGIVKNKKYISINSDQIILYLLKYRPKEKDRKLVIIPDISKEYKKSFIKGLFDIRGSYYLPKENSNSPPKLQFCLNNIYHNYIKNIFQEELNIKGYLFEDRIVFTNYKNVNSILNWLGIILNE